MTPEQVKEIVYECLENVAGGWVKSTPKLTTQQVADVLGRSKGWVLQNREKFAPKRKNKRGDFIYDTKKVIDYLKS